MPFTSIYDPPYGTPPGQYRPTIPNCSSIDNPMCSVLAVDSIGLMNGLCAYYKRGDFVAYIPPGYSSVYAALVFDAIVPNAIIGPDGNPPDTVDFSNLFVWIHVGLGLPGSDQPWTSTNNRVALCQLDGTLILNLGTWSASPEYAESVFQLALSSGVYLATLENPLRLQVWSDGAWGADFQTDATQQTLEWAGAVWTNQFCQVPPAAPIPPILDMATDADSSLYLVMVDSTAWVFSGNTRTQLYIDADMRQKASGMVAVACAGDAAFYCDWKGQLWATGNVYVQNDVTGEWIRATISGYLVKVPIKADQITLMGPHGIGPSYQNNTALWVNNQRNLIGLGDQADAELENGLLPSSPASITQPTGGGYNWPAPDDGSAVAVFPTPFDYRQYIWRALATSNVGAYAYFGAKVGGPIRPQGHMIG
jgi:hypothetical protein